MDTISGIEEVTSTITNGSFSISVELQDEISDAVSAAKQYLQVI